MSSPNITIKQLLDAKVHLGHLSRFREPKMAEFIYGIKNGLDIINLEKTQTYLLEALAFISQLSERTGSKILFVGTKRAAQATVKEQAIRAGMPYVDLHWPGGMLTNYRTIRQSVKRLKELESLIQNSGFDGLTKKETLNLQRKYNKLIRDFGGIKEMSGLPDLGILFGAESIALAEFVKLRIPVIRICDTNYPPTQIDYIIPGNDDALSSLKLYTTLAADAVIAGRERARRNTQENNPTPKSEPVIKTVKKAQVTSEQTSVKTTPPLSE